jgi:hypothetical protein
MKIGTILVAASVAVTSACTVETMDDVGTVKQNTEICHNPDGYYGMLAALAVAVGVELREWEATTYFYNNGWRDMRITEEAKQICQANGRDLCGNIQAILDLQQIDYITAPDGSRVFDGIQFYQQMSVYLERQKIWEGRTGANSCGPRPHSVQIIEVGSGLCTSDYTFSVETEVDPADLICKLKFAGWPENTWLQFRSTQDTITLDPGAGMIEDAPSQDPNCQTAYTVYDPDGDQLGGPCCPDGFDGGTLEPSSWNADTLVCTW